MTIRGQDIEIGECSLTGDRHNNQDRCIQMMSGGSALLAVADGMGGHPLGDVAAQILVDICEHNMHRQSKPIQNPRRFLTGILELAHQEIQLFGQQQSPQVQPRTTAVVALIQDAAVHWVYAGDSRLYLLRDNNLLTRTIDHSYVERLRQQGIITEHQLERHPQRNYVTRCLGGSGSLPETSYEEHALKTGDVLVLCSDGLWSSVDDDLMSDALFSDQEIGEAVTALAEEAAQAAFPESDNVTIIACRVGSLSGNVEEIGNSNSRIDQAPGKLDTAIAELQNAIDRYETEQKPDNE